jgi:hypothetical protein
MSMASECLAAMKCTASRVMWGRPSVRGEASEPVRMWREKLRIKFEAW